MCEEYGACFFNSTNQTLCAPILLEACRIFFNGFLLLMSCMPQYSMLYRSCHPESSNTVPFIFPRKDILKMEVRSLWEFWQPYGRSGRMSYQLSQIWMLNIFVVSLFNLSFLQSSRWILYHSHYSSNATLSKQYGLDSTLRLKQVFSSFEPFSSGSCFGLSSEIGNLLNMIGHGSITILVGLLNVIWRLCSH